MTDGQWLFLVFALLYLLECVRWAPQRAVILSDARSYWRLLRPSDKLRWRGLHPLLLDLWPGHQIHVMTMAWPVAPTERGVEVLDAEGQAETFVPWEDLKPRAEGERLELGQGWSLPLPDEETAKVWEKTVLKWRKMSLQGRVQDFEQRAAGCLRPADLTRAAKQVRRHLRAVRLVATCIFVWTFGVVTAVYSWWGDGTEVLVAAGTMFLLTATQAVLFLRASKRLPWPVRYRFWKALGVLLLPQHAMRAADALCRSAPPIGHPLAAKELLKEADWKRLAVAFWKNARHGKAQSCAVERRVLEGFFGRLGMSGEELEEAPQRENGAAGYCPRCLSQFRESDAVCDDCGGLRVMAWPEQRSD